jgi:predicted GNAT family acetyltransferase
MNWYTTDDPEHYAEQVLPLLTRRPVQNTIALTALDALRAGSHFGPDKPLLAWYDDAGTVTGAVSMTPPYGVLLSELPSGSEAELVELLRESGLAIPDVNGTPADVDRFIEQWQPASTELLMRHRLYELDQLTPPADPPAGTARPAGLAEFDLVMGWMTAFRAEVEPWSTSPHGSIFRRRIELGLIWLWLDPAGTPVSMAGRNPNIAGMSRVGPVYTPPAARRHGYAAAVTHACTRDAQEHGVEHVILFTDVANPTSNSIYQQLGYRPLEDRMILRFTG